MVNTLNGIFYDINVSEFLQFVMTRSSTNKSILGCLIFPRDRLMLMQNSLIIQLQLIQIYDISLLLNC